MAVTEGDETIMFYRIVEYKMCGIVETIPIRKKKLNAIAFTLQSPHHTLKPRTEHRLYAKREKEQRKFL